ncbi:MAG: hypothetical protein ACO4AN_02935 [Candidatus Nanopelagicales bacterium]
MKTRKEGETSTTAILIKKYGRPQIIYKATKRNRPRRVIDGKFYLLVI